MGLVPWHAPLTIDEIITFSMSEWRSACREDALKRELADITRRSQAAESRHEELATALPEATRPLLRQIEAMQAANAANAQAWAAAERTLHDRLSAAEAHAAASGGFLPMPTAFIVHDNDWEVAFSSANIQLYRRQCGCLC